MEEKEYIVEFKELTKDYIDIKIDGEPIGCIVMKTGIVFIDAKIEKFFSKDGTSTHKPVEINGIDVYPLKIALSRLKPRILIQLAMDGVLYRINKAIEERDNPKERVLSEFDKMILKAVNYNPKERET